MGLELTLTIGADGAAEMNMNGEGESIQCSMQDGVLTADGVGIALQDGMLVVSEDGMTMTLSREKPEASAAPIPVIDESATIDDLKGVWTLARVTADGMTLPAEAAEMAGDTLVIYGDTCDLTLQGMTMDGLTCSMDGCALLVSILDGEAAATLREDGTVSHAANSTGSGAVIFKKVSNKENAWKFIKWFTETDTQVQYGTQIEGLLGTMGRFDTANVEALGQLSWSNDELARLRDQQEELVEIPIIPSSYAVTRNIMNAFREVVNNAENPRDTLVWYNRDINDEITRKRENLGLDTDKD